VAAVHYVAAALKQSKLAMVTTRSGRDNCSVALRRQGDRRTVSAAGPHGTTAGSVPGLAGLTGFGSEKGDAVAAQRKGGEAPSYLLPAEVAELLSVSPKTVSRWAKEGKLPFMKTLGGHRRYPEAEIRQLVDELRQEPTA
jgi:excisionase family DNA binding protein